MQFFVETSLDAMEATLKSVLESEARKENLSGQTVKIDTTLSDVYVVNSDNLNYLARPIITILEIGGE